MTTPKTVTVTIEINDEEERFRIEQKMSASETNTNNTSTILLYTLGDALAGAMHRVPRAHNFLARLVCYLAETRLEKSDEPGMAEMFDGIEKNIKHWESVDDEK